MRVPARAGFVSTVRLAAASLGALCELTVDDVDDLRLIVDEACSVVLAVASPGADLRVGFELEPGCLGVQASVDTDGAVAIDRSGLAWTVLQALASSVDVSSDAATVSVRVSKRRAGSRR